MTQLIVYIEDTSLLAELKNAIKKLHGVVSISESTETPSINSTTKEAMEDAIAGKTIKCRNFEEYLEAAKP